MMQKDGQTGSLSRRILYIALKTLVYFVVINCVYAVLQPTPLIAQLTVYHSLVPPRARFSLYNDSGNAVGVIQLDEMFATHEISSPPQPDEFRVGMFGPSSIWGFGVNWDNTVTACINKQQARMPDGRRIHAFNLAMPLPSVIRDLMLMHRAVNYHLDAMYWFIGGVGIFRPHTFIASPVITANPNDLYAILDRYPIRLPAGQTLPDRQPSFLDRTLIGERDVLATWLQDQLAGIRLAQSNQDFGPLLDLHYNPNPRDEDNLFFLDRHWSQGEVGPDDFALDAVNAGNDLAKDAGVPLTILDEPMWISPPGLYKIRYNPYYPRWYFDLLNQSLDQAAKVNHWNFYHWYNALDNAYFTDSPFHFTSEGACILANKLIPLIQQGQKS